MCLVRVHIFGVRANSRAPDFFSNALQCTSSMFENVGNQFSFISLSSCIMGIASRRLRAVYSASVVDSAICFCSLLHQMIWQPANMMA